MSQGQSAESDLGTLLDRPDASPGHLSFFERVESARAQACARGCRLAVLAIGIDGFQAVEALGHATADEVLATLSHRLKSCVGDPRKVAWLGADRFAVLFDGIPMVEEVMALADRLLVAVAAPLDLENRQLRLTASIGVALDESRPMTGDLLRDAEVAMLEARAPGGACVEVFVPAQRDRALQRLWTEHELRGALDHDELRVVFEPIVTLDQPSYIAGVQADLRWEHPLRGFIPASEFTPVARGTNLVVPLERWLLSSACAQAARCALENPQGEHPFLSVEVSACHLVQADFVTYLADVMTDTGIDPARTMLFIRDPSPEPGTCFLDAVDGLKAVGVRLFLGELSLKALLHVSRFPIDGFKVGRSLVAGVDDDTATTATTAIVDAALGVARELSLQAIAEGVETERQAQRLARLGCRLGQGLLFSRPVPRTALPALIARGRPPRGWEPPLPDRSRSRVPRMATGRGQEAEHRNVTLREATEALGVSANTVRRWADRGLIRTVRTQGGHRRFRAADISAVQRERRGGPVLRCAGLPRQAAPAAAQLIERLGEEVMSRVAESLYERGSSGWFRSDEANAHGREWVQTLASGLRTAEYTDALEVSGNYLRRARLGGASLLECHIALERFTQALVQMAGQHDCPIEDVIAVRRLLAGVDHVLLERV